MYYVYINRASGRVLVTRKKQKEWTLYAAYSSLKLALAAAKRLADLYDYILEWDPPKAQNCVNF
ncbi:MAG: hypothetical protein QXD08_09450 [Pyrobaculum sp.]